MNTNYLQQSPPQQFQHQNQYAYGYQLPPSQPRRQQPQFSQAPPSVQKGTLTPGQNITVGKIHVVVEKYLSEGGFAHVYLVKTQEPINGTDRHVLKRVAVREKSLLEEVRKEVEVMKLLRGHPNIVNLLDADAFHLPDGTHEVLILMEFCSGGGIIDLMNSRLQTRLTEPEILQIFVDVCEGVAKMHSIDPAPLVHRDLKIENILQAGENIFKICDFGSVCTPRTPPRNVQEMRELEMEIGTHTTLQYRAPEMVDVYQRRPINEKADIWALGILLYKLAYYTTPFEAQGPLAILNVQYRIPSFPVYSNHLNLLIGSMLQEHSVQRPSAVQLLKTVHALRGTRSTLTYKEPKSAQSKIDEPNLYDIISSVPSSTPASSANLNITPMRRGRPTKGDNAPSPTVNSAFNASKPSAPVKPVEPSNVPTSTFTPKSSFVPVSSFSSTFDPTSIKNEIESEEAPPPLPPRNPSSTNDEEDKKEPEVDQKFDGFEDSFDAGSKTTNISVLSALNPQPKQRQSTAQSFSLIDELQQPKPSSTSSAPAATTSSVAETQPLISREITSSPSFDERYPSIESLDIQSSSSFSGFSSSVNNPNLESRGFETSGSLLQPSRKNQSVILSSSPGPISPSSSFGGDFVPHSGRHLTGGIEKTFDLGEKPALAPSQIKSAQVTGMAFTEGLSVNPNAELSTSRVKPRGSRETWSGPRFQSGLNLNGSKVSKALANLTGEQSVNENDQSTKSGLDGEEMAGAEEGGGSILQKTETGIANKGKPGSQRNTDWLTGNDVSPSPSQLISPTIPSNNRPPKPSVAPKPTSFNRPSSTSSSHTPDPASRKPSLPATSPKPQILSSISPSAAYKSPPVSTTTKPVRPPTLSKPSQTSSILSDQWSPLEAARAKFKEEKPSGHETERPDSSTRRESTIASSPLTKQASASLTSKSSGGNETGLTSDPVGSKTSRTPTNSSGGMPSSTLYGFNSAQPRKLPTIDSESASAFLKGSTGRSGASGNDRGSGLGIRTRPQSMYTDSISSEATTQRISSPSFFNSKPGLSPRPTSSQDLSRSVSMMSDPSKYESEKEKKSTAIAAPVPQRRSSPPQKLVESIEGSVSTARVQPSSAQTFVRQPSVSRMVGYTVGSVETGRHVAPPKKALKPVTPENTGGANVPDVVKSRSYRAEIDQEEQTNEKKKSVQDMINRWNQGPR